MFFEFNATGTKWEIKIFNKVNGPEILKKEILTFIENAEKKFSRFKSDSHLSKFNQKGIHDLDEDFFLLFTTGIKLGDLSNNSYSLGVGNILKSYGYDENYSFKEDVSLRNFKNTFYINQDNQLVVEHENSFDLGSIAKGYIADQLKEILSKEYSNFFIHAGGDICHYSNDNSSIKVAIENPLNTDEAIAELTLNNKAIATSSSNRRRFNDFHHLIDAVTLTPSNKILSISVVHENAYIADSTSTAIFVSEPQCWDSIIKNYDLDCLIIYHDLTYDLFKSKSRHLDWNIFS